MTTDSKRFYKHSNQQINPQSNKKTVDSVGNPRFRLFFKSGNSTMLLAKGLTKNQIKILTAELKDNLDNYDSKLEGSWIVVK